MPQATLCNRVLKISVQIDVAIMILQTNLIFFFSKFEMEKKYNNKFDKFNVSLVQIWNFFILVVITYQAMLVFDMHNSLGRI